MSKSTVPIHTLLNTMGRSQVRQLPSSKEDMLIVCETLFDLWLAKLQSLVLFLLSSLELVKSASYPPFVIV